MHSIPHADPLKKGVDTLLNSTVSMLNRRQTKVVLINQAHRLFPEAVVGFANVNGLRKMEGARGAAAVRHFTKMIVSIQAAAFHLIDSVISIKLGPDTNHGAVTVGENGDTANTM